MGLSVAVQDLLHRHHRGLAFAGLALLVLGAWTATSAYHAPIETRHVERVERWTETAAFTYSVPVTRNSTHYPIGSTLPMGEPAYFRTISDSVNVTFAWDVSSDDPAFRGVAAGHLAVQVRAQTVDGRPYWSVEHTLDEATSPEAAQGLRLAGRLDLDALLREAETLAAELPPGDGIINWTVRATVVYALETAQGREQAEKVHVLPVSMSDPRVVLPGPDALRWEETHAEEQVRVASAPGGVAQVLRSGKALSLLGGGLGALALGSLAARWSGPDGRFERAQRKYRDYISVAGSVPATAHANATFVDVQSLEDLIQVAADARTRVLLDARTRIFYALLPGVTYRYAGHAA